MEKFKDKKTGAIFTINDVIVLDFFKNNANYEKIEEKAKKKTSSKEETTSLE